MKYTYYRPNKQVIGLHVTKKSFKDAVKLISGRQVIAEHPERADSELAQLESALRAQSVDKNKA